MAIVTYWDLKPKSDLLPLMDQAFGWPFSERDFNKFVRVDPRLRNGSVGFCVLEDGKVVSYVGVMDLATRTLNGELEHVGGIYGVATLPGYTRKGFSTTLFNAAHDYFREKGYRFSFLNTSPTLVAYYLYKKLGYSDVFACANAYKTLMTKTATASKETAVGKPNLDKVLSFYNKYVKDRVGFVARDRQYLEMLVKDKRLTGKGIVFAKEGYVVFRRESYWTRIYELVALTRKATEELLEAVEQKSRDVILARAVLDKSLLALYRSRGYTILNDAHSVFMVKPLEGETSFKQAYGEEFFQTELDHF